MKMFRSVICTAALAAFLAVPGAATAGQYVTDAFYDLGVGEAVAVNSSGMVAGNDGTYGYTWSAGVYDRFGEAYTDTSEVVGINDSGTVIGVAGDHNFQYNSTTGISYVTDTAGNEVAMMMTGINSAGKIVGFNHSEGKAYMVDNGTVTTLEGVDRAYGINDSDQVAGYIWDGPVAPNYWQRGVIYDHGNVTVLGAMGTNPDMSFAEGINNNGDVYGTSWTGDNYGNYTAYFWKGGSDPDALQEVPNFAGDDNGATYIYGMNDLGMLVGKSHNGDGSFNWRGVLFDGEDLIDLNDIVDLEDGWYINDVKDINEDGMIVGTILKEIGDETIEHAFAMQVRPVPVPAAVWLLASGFLGMLGVRRKISA